MNTQSIPTPPIRTTAHIALDKSFPSVSDETYGTIEIRVVVLQKRVISVTPEPETPADAEEDEIFATSTAKSPLAVYLEDPKRGKECIVFLVNGQRQEAWDNAFIQRDLGFKYLRNRTMVVVTLDGLKPEALADIMQGSREHFYPGTVYSAIVGRVTSTLKKDPELEALEAEAERQISELRSGDEAVKNALDQLIDEHHAHGDHLDFGGREAGAGQGGQGVGANRAQDVIVDPSATGGVPAEGPYLTSDNASEKVRLIPEQKMTIRIRSMPAGTFPTVEDISVAVLPATPGLIVKEERTADALNVHMVFTEPDDFDADGYPIDATLRVVARVRDLPEPRLLEKKLVIARPTKRPPPPAVVLNAIPTYLKVTSRQPVRLVRGSADTHVRLKWDGQDHLTSGTPPAWTFQATCRTQPLPPMTFSRPRTGRFELLIPTPADLPAGVLLDFDVEAHGPGGSRLTVSFNGEVVEPAPPPPPRRLKTEIPDGATQRRPPYRLSYITAADYAEVGLWQDDRLWTFGDAGCFHEPSASMPLTLVINEDFLLLDQLRKSMTTGARKLDPATVERRITRYTSHIAFHLYQMYTHYRSRQAANERDPEAKAPSTDEMNGEINRVAATLTKMMQVAT